MMKKRFIAFFILVIALACLLVSCNKKKDPPKQDPVINDECVYSPGTDLVVVNDGTVSAEIVDLLFAGIYEARGEVPKMVSDPSGFKHVIFLGKNDSELSKKSYTRLERLEKNNADDVGAVITTDGYSIAIAFDEDICNSDIAAKLAVDHLINNIFTSDTLSCDTGVLFEKVVGIIEYQSEIDDRLVEDRWNELLADLGTVVGENDAAEIVNSLKKCYALFDDDVVYWLASLYDPTIGGFYYSNSGRDTVGYLPDLESTYQALSFMGGTGLGENLSVAERIPDWMVKQIISFAKSLQDPESGYFYHPQWGGESFADRRDFIDGTFDSRKGRDLQWGVNLLRNLGSAPTYDTPLGDKGDGILADGTSVLPTGRNLEQKLGQSTVSAVSKVILTNSDSSVPSQLRDVESLKSYLAKLDVKNDSYYVGNLLESQSKQIVARDKVLDKSGRTTPLADVVKAYFDNSQNPETGMWTDGDEITYDGVNGLLKISGVYNGIQKEIPNPIRALNSAMAGITIETAPTTVCYVLNPWYAITNIIDNVSKYSSSSDKAQVQEDINALRSEILKNAVELIDITREKTAKFVKDDGSFSYFPTTSGPNSQGVPVAVTGSNEGDVNATYMFISGIPNHIFGILGYDFIPVLTRADRYALWYALDDLGEIVKDEQEEPVPVDFEDESVGTLPFGVTSSATSIGSAIEVVKTNGKNGSPTKAVALTTRPGGSDTVRFGLDNYAIFYNAVIFETDLRFESNGGSGQIEMIPYGSSADAYRLIFDYADGGNVTVRTINDFKSTYVAKEGEWFRLRLEYSFADIDYDRNGTKDLLVKLYVDGNHIATGYTPAAANVLKSGNVSGVRFFSWTAADATLYIDNLLFKQGTVEFDPPPVVNKEDTAEKLTFEASTSENIPGKVGTSEMSKESSLVIETLTNDEGANKILGLLSSNGVYDKLKFYITKPSNGLWNSVAFETDLLVKSESGSFEMYFASSYSATAAKLIVTVTNGMVNVNMVDASGDESRSVNVAEINTFFKLRIELTTSTRSTLVNIYCNGELVLTSDKYFDKPLNTYNVNNLSVYVKDTTAMTVYFDNVVCEQFLKLSEGESEDIGIDFEDVTLDDLAEKIVFEKADSSSVDIFEDVREGHITSALKLLSPKNAIDVLRFLSAEGDESTDTVVFETEIKLCDADGDNSFAIYHKTADGRIANKLIFGYSASTGSIFAQNQYLTSDGNGRDFSQVLLYEGVGDYFKLRIEYSKVSEREVKTKIFINGVELTFAESITPYSGGAIEARDISEVVFETLSTKKLTLCFDNVELYHEDMIEDAPPTVEPDIPPLVGGDGGEIFGDDYSQNLDNGSWTN